MGEVIYAAFPRYRTQEEAAMEAALEHLAVSIFDTLHLPGVPSFWTTNAPSDMPPEAS